METLLNRFVLFELAELAGSKVITYTSDWLLRLRCDLRAASYVDQP